jgi:tetratricopeptide (TPR) repeat protein
MRPLPVRPFVAAIVALAVNAPFVARTASAAEPQPIEAAQAPGHVHSAAKERLGTVHFATSCTEQAQPRFDRAVSLLHSFEFGPAIDAFNEALTVDPSCAMTQWGIALSHWSNPFGLNTRAGRQLDQGLAAVERGRAIGARTERERAWLEAVALLYVDVGRRSQQERVQAYRDAMEVLARTHPDDMEAAIFFALSLTAAEDPADKTYASRLRAVGILEPLFRAHPEHPGLAHYIIHSYDVPALASRALEAAERYADIAPSASHALHMPSHTFTRVGLWQKSIDANIASAGVARDQRVTGEELHASDYEMYAYLQTAQDAAARRLLDALPDIISRFDAKSTQGAAPPSAAYFAMAAIPARWALERGVWSDAATLELRPSGFPYVDALTEFARALGAARARDAAAVRTALGRLEALRTEQVARNEPYWTQQIQIQRDSAAAWLAFVEGRQAEAIAAMRAAADAEDRTEKAAVTPGPLAPAREQLGEMLLASGDARGAREAFEATLVKEPNRFRALAGAARAAAAAGDPAGERQHLQALVAMCDRADTPGRAELQQARATLAR